MLWFVSLFVCKYEHPMNIYEFLTSLFPVLISATVRIWFIFINCWFIIERIEICVVLTEIYFRSTNKKCANNRKKATPAWSQGVLGPVVSPCKGLEVMKVMSKPRLNRVNFCVSKLSRSFKGKRDFGSFFSSVDHNLPEVKRGRKYLSKAMVILWKRSLGVGVKGGLMAPWFPRRHRKKGNKQLLSFSAAL